MTSFQLKISGATAIVVICALAILLVTAESSAAARKTTQRTFASPEAAVQALIDALRRNDEKALRSIFGPGSRDVISSGDKVHDRNKRESFVKAYDEAHTFEQEGPDKVVLHTGTQNWPMPIPIVKKGNRWVFDSKAGREEIINRRIGRNELYTIQTCLAIVDAQREYALKDRDGDGLFEYAEKFSSDPGRKNGLYWPVQEGEDPSPLGELVAKARAEGYSGKTVKGNPSPYHGYYFRILKGQGGNAPGGAFEYAVNGHMIGGFAVVAWPAKYGVSGVMTFVVNHDGVVYQRDLGKGTAEVARTIVAYNPDSTWQRIDETAVAGVK